MQLECALKTNIDDRVKFQHLMEQYRLLNEEAINARK